MGWHHISSIALDNLIFDVAGGGSAMFLRTSAGVYCINLLEEPALGWSHPLPGDLVFSYKPILNLPGAVVTVAHHENNSDDMRLIALDPESGALLWERPVAWSQNKTCGGVLAVDGKLALLEDPQQPRLLVLDPASGTALHESPPLTVNVAAGRMTRPTVGVQAGGSLYHAWWNAGLYRITPNTADPVPEQVLQGAIGRMIVSGTQIYLTLSKQPAQLLWLDGVTGEERGRLALPSGWEIDLLSPTLPEHTGMVLIHLKNNHGIAAANLSDGRIQWHRGDAEGWQVMAAADTPYGLALVVGGSEDHRLVCLDLQTGADLPAPDTPVSYRVFWSGEALVASHSVIAKLFRWQADAAGSSTPRSTSTDAPPPALTAAAPTSALSNAPPSAPTTAATPAPPQVQRTAQDEAFSAVISAFIDTMRADEGSAEQLRLGQRFNQLCDCFFTDHPEASLASIALGVVQLGVPYEQAFQDVAWARTLGSPPKT